MTTNIQKLRNHNNAQVRLFAETITSLSVSQGFYGRLCRDIDQFGEADLDNLIQDLSEHRFKDAVDVVLWLET